MKLSLTDEEWAEVLEFWECPSYSWYRRWRRIEDGFAVLMDAKRPGKTVEKTIGRADFDWALKLALPGVQIDLIRDVGGADEDTRDAVIQLAVLGEIVFG